MSWEWKPYVPVAMRRAQAVGFAQRLAKKEGRPLQPVKIDGRTIARTFWGKAWCDNLESYSDFENRLPRGRTYARNGSVVDLKIEPGRVKAYVSGSEIYEVKIEINQVHAAAWKRIKSECSASIDSLIDLLAGRFSEGVMRRLTRPTDGLFPQPKQIRMECSCPDWAVLCKHVAAVLYGIGARLDEEPQLLFLLRHVDHNELVSQAASAENLSGALGKSSDSLVGEDLGKMFDIDLDSTSPGDEGARQRGRRPRARTRPATRSRRATGSAGATAAPSSKAKVAARKPVAKKKTSRKKRVAPAKRLHGKQSTQS